MQTTHIGGNTYSFSTDPEYIEQQRKEYRIHERKVNAFNDAMKDLVEGMDIPYSFDDEDLLMFIARIAEATDGTMPITICPLCGNTDDWHNNNNAECR